MIIYAVQDILILLKKQGLRKSFINNNSVDQLIEQLNPKTTNQTTQ